MPNLVQAAAEGMPKLTRRTALAMSSAGIVSAITVLSATRPAPAADHSLVTLDDLISRHTAAYELDEQLWNRVIKIDDAIGSRRPKVRVQIGRIYRGRDDCGAEILDPIWGYSAADIDKHQQIHLEADLLLWRGSNENERKIREKHATRADKKKAELAEIQAEAKRIEDEAGYTAARATAEASAQVESDLKDQIVNFKPETPAAVARLAGWTASVPHLEQRDLERILANIAASTGQLRRAV